MASGSSARVNSKSFDFASDDILCSYDDFGTQTPSNAINDEPDISTNPSKDFQKSRMTRTSMIPTSSCNLPEDSLSQEVFSAVEKGMKKHTDNIMRFLEGISSRLSELELYCYNLDKSIGEMRSELNQNHDESESKLKFLEKHVQEVHRSVQILRDKQELAETQTELAKLHLAQKDSSSLNHVQSSERASPPVPDTQKTDKASDQQLALAITHQVAPQQQPAIPISQAPAQNVSQVNAQQPYYRNPTLSPNHPTVAQLPLSQYLPSDPQYRTPQPQMQDLSRLGQQVAQSQVIQASPAQQFAQYQQQQQQQPWPQQLPQQIRPPQQPSTQQSLRPTSTNVYSPYLPTQPRNPSPQETTASNMPMQMSYSGISQVASSHADTVSYGYSGTGRPVAQHLAPPPHTIKASFSVPPDDVYGSTGTHSAVPPGSGYMIYENDGGRIHPHQPPHFTQGGYQPASASIQNPQASNHLANRNQRQSQIYRGHPYSELIEKTVSMGFRSDHVANIIQRMEENRQSIDFNSVLDRLNHSVGSQRPWSG